MNPIKTRDFRCNFLKEHNLTEKYLGVNYADAKEANDFQQHITRGPPMQNEELHNLWSTHATSLRSTILSKKLCF